MKCGICNKRFKTENAYRSHMTFQHGKFMPEIKNDEFLENSRKYLRSYVNKTEYPKWSESFIKQAKPELREKLRKEKTVFRTMKDPRFMDEFRSTGW